MSVCVASSLYGIVWSFPVPHIFTWGSPPDSRTQPHLYCSMGDYVGESHTRRVVDKAKQRCWHSSTTVRSRDEQTPCGPVMKSTRVHAVHRPTRFIPSAHLLCLPILLLTITFQNAVTEFELLLFEPHANFYANVNKPGRARSTNIIPMKHITTVIAHQTNYSITKPKVELRQVN